MCWYYSVSDVFYVIITDVFMFVPTNNSSVSNIIFFFITDASFTGGFVTSVNPSVKLIPADFSLFFVDN